MPKPDLLDGQPPEEPITETTDPAESYLPPVASPYEIRRMTAWDHLKISAYWFGSNFVWGALLGPVMAEQMTKLAPGRTAEALGLLYSIGAFPALVIPLVAGAMSDRCTSRWGRRRPFILAGGLGALLGLLGMMLASNVSSLVLYYLAYMVLQFGSNTALAAYSGVIPDLVPPHERGKASGFMAFMSQFSTLFGALLGGKLISTGQIFSVYYMLIGVFGLFLVFSVLGIKEYPLRGPVEKLDWLTYFKSLWIDPRKYPDFAWVWVTRALMMVGFYSLQPYILYYLRDIVHVDHPASQAGKLIGIILLFATLSGLIGGWVSDRIGRKPVVYLASGVIAVMSLTFVYCSNLEQVALAGILFGLGYGAYISVDWALGTDVLPNKAHAGKDMAVWHVSMTLPQQVAPLLAGTLLGLFRIPQTHPAQYQPMGYTVIFGFAAICFAIGGYFLRNVRSVT